MYWVLAFGQSFLIQSLPLTKYHTFFRNLPPFKIYGVSKLQIEKMQSQRIKKHWVHAQLEKILSE